MLAAIAFVAVLFLIYRGVSGAKNAVKKAHATRMKAWKKRNPKASKTQRKWASFGQMLAALRYGPPAFKAAAGEGFREGWAFGKAKADQIRPSPLAAKIAEKLAETAAKKKADAAQQAKDQPPQVEPARPAKQAPPPEGPKRPPGSGDGPQSPRPDPPGQPTGSPTTQQQQSADQPLTAEFNTGEELLAILEEFYRQAAASKQDTMTARLRALQHTAFTTDLVARMREKEFPAAQIDEIKKLADPCGTAEDALVDCVAAEDAKTRGAAAAVDIATKHVDLAGRAAGEMYS